MMVLLSSRKLIGVPLQKFSASMISANPRTQYICPTAETWFGTN
jgi:hypothetical protein